MKTLHIVPYVMDGNNKFWIVTSDRSRFHKKVLTYRSMVLALNHAWARKREGDRVIVYNRTGTIISLIENEKHLIEFEKKLFQ